MANTLYEIEFESQNEDLAIKDWCAIHACLEDLSDPYLLFYNCGVDSGASQPHKHVQVIPLSQVDPENPDQEPPLRQAINAYLSSSPSLPTQVPLSLPLKNHY